MSATAHEITFLVNHIFGSSGTHRTNYYIGLLLAVPNLTDGTYSEVSTSGGSGYARQTLGNNKTALTTAAAGTSVVSNVSSINFPAAATNWGVVLAVGLFDASSNGNLLYSSTLSSGKPFGVGDVAFFNAGDISFTVQNVLD